MPKLAVAYPSWGAHTARYSGFLILLPLSSLCWEPRQDPLQDIASRLRGPGARVTLSWDHSWELPEVGPSPSLTALPCSELTPQP